MIIRHINVELIIPNEKKQNKNVENIISRYLKFKFCNLYLNSFLKLNKKVRPRIRHVFAILLPSIVP